MAALRAWQSHYTYFDDLESIQAWKPTPHPLPDLPIVPLNRHRQRFNDRPLIIHCHDLDNGYNEHKHDVISYNFTHWAHIDTFIYFSHHTLTIPPPHWINAAHRNGVDCLGTFITEWDRGEIINRQLLKDTTTLRAYADQLVDICQHYGFDGYLINIEAKLTDRTQRSPDEKKVEDAADNPTTHTENDAAHQTISAAIDLSDAESRVSSNGVDYTLRMVEFLDYLTKRLHDAVLGGRIIWYDSVSALNAQLRWQSVLNEHNIPFFNVVDALFTDYHWKAEWPAVSARNAGKRRYDVYTGIDLFGRGTYGGGGHNAHAAMAAITEAQTSIALFAPSWTFEGTGAALISRNKYDEEENKLWIGKTKTATMKTTPDSNDQHDHSTAHEQCIGQYAATRIFSLTSLLPYQCEFNSGYGHRYYENGVCIRPDPWYDMNVQSIQVTLTDDVRQGAVRRVSLMPNTDIVVSVALEYEKEGRVWSGGSSLSIECTLPAIQCPPFDPITVALPIHRFHAAPSGGADITVNLRVDCVYEYLQADTSPFEMQVTLRFTSSDCPLADFILPKSGTVIGKWLRVTRDVQLPHSALHSITDISAIVAISAQQTVSSNQTIAVAAVIGYIAISSSRTM